MASKKGEQKALKLAAVLDLNEASNLKANILSMRGAPLTIDASGVERVGAQCVQVLMAGSEGLGRGQASRSRMARASEAFDKTLQLIGVEHRPSAR
ncbi:MAG: STAS domain-containing protein [Rhizobium sp.]|nr:STAS domain-containing protein [Rhizobium sp.]